MNTLKPVLLGVLALVLVLVVLSFVRKPVSAPTQTTTVQETNLGAELNSLDATDLDTGADTQLDQLNSDSSSF